MIQKALVLIFFALSLGACAGTGTWIPIDPATGSQEKSDMDMQYCVQYGENMGHGLAVFSLPMRNSHVESCMRKRGYRKIDEAPGEKPAE